MILGFFFSPAPLYIQNIHLPSIIWILLFLTFLPMVSALPQAPFPHVSFKVFSEFIDANFSTQISLATVLTILFTMTDNPDLLTLHSRQQNPECAGEVKTKVSSWIKCLSRALTGDLEIHHHHYSREKMNIKLFIQMTVSLKLGKNWMHFPKSCIYIPIILVEDT